MTERVSDDVAVAFDVEAARELIAVQIGHALADLSGEFMEQLGAACDEIDRLQASLEAAEADAERGRHLLYEWFREDVLNENEYRKRVDAFIAAHEEKDHE